MIRISKFKRCAMVLTLGASVSGITSWDSSAKSAPLTTPEKAPVSKSDDKSESSSKFDISKGFSSITDKAIMAVVNVSTTQILENNGGGKEGFPQFPPGSPFEDFFKEFFDRMDRPARKVQSLGSGFIIQSDETSAKIVTNYHVIADAKKVTIFLHDNTELEATVLAFDERTDLALLKVNTENLPAAKRKLPVLEWGDSNAAKVGDWILAIGNPFGLGSTVTSGIISNRARDIMLGKSGRNRNDYVDDFMQHDAAINMGNSGGPLISLDGKVVGINTAIFSPSGGNIGIGFAIPAAVAQDTINQLIQFGRTKRGWLGVRIQPVTPDIAESLGLPGGDNGKKSIRGAIVGSVTPEGPAAKAKIEPEDIILEFDGKEVNEKQRLSRVVGETSVGKTVKVKIWRKGKEMMVDVVLGEFETAPDYMAASPSDKEKATPGVEGVEVLGMKLSALTPELRERFKLPKEAKGILVMKVDPNSTAAEAGLRGVDGRGAGRDKANDIIEKVNLKELTKPEEFAKVIEDIKKENEGMGNKKEGRKNVLLLITRDGESRFVPLKLENDDLKETPKNKN